MVKAALIATVGFVLLAGVVRAQETSPDRRTIEVSGNSEAQAAPDKATLALAIETHAATAAQAAGANGAMAQKVRDALKAKLGDQGKMWTGGYSLYPDYSEPRDGGEAKIIGYRAQNSITVETGALDLVGPLIDAAIAAGANRVDSLDYGLRDETAARNQAIAQATGDAQSQAEALARALNVKLGPVLKATTVSQERPVPVMRMQAAAMAAGAATPIEAGQVTVPASVTLTYQIQ
ncbi:MAG TPA: SIMPL domain-containing protein [Candidatus Binataceae bacterium]|nr:SIMPL domain-containing protein [Candidatus Binataceae bacterium]